MEQSPLELPFRTLTYRLGQRDALAGASLGRLPTKWEKLRMMIIIAVAGFGAAALPQSIPSPWWGITVAAIVLAGAAGALLVSNLVFRREVERLPIPSGDVRLEAFADQLVERSARGDRIVPLDKVSMVVATDGHLFVREGKLPIIVPAHAFASRNDMDQFARFIEAAEEKVELQD